MAKMRGYSARLNRIIVLLFNTLITKHSFIFRKAGDDLQFAIVLPDTQNYVYINNKLFGAKICSDICPRRLSVPRSEQFSESEARGKL